MEVQWFLSFTKNIPSFITPIAQKFDNCCNIESHFLLEYTQNPKSLGDYVYRYQAGTPYYVRFLFFGSAIIIAFVAFLMGM